MSRDHGCEPADPRESQRGWAAGPAPHGPWPGRCVGAESCPGPAQLQPRPARTSSSPAPAPVLPQPRPSPAEHLPRGSRDLSGTRARCQGSGSWAVAPPAAGTSCRNHQVARLYSSQSPHVGVAGDFDAKLRSGHSTEYTNVSLKATGVIDTNQMISNNFGMFPEKFC